MEVRFKKTVRLLPFVRLNFGKTGFNSVSIGGRLIRLNIGRGGVYLSGSLTGTGLSFRKRLNKPAAKEKGK
ncbi:MULTISPECIES: DUF4236 domain-containing protein [unclassified Vibrio]|uniref:DUF4236 domain-containing protein n=1 Tax=Vibrio TaxID=662 RepID=UPI0012680F3D|nr:MULTISPECIES: DUF4236 domain-containing protein [unclassified Vibrio]QFT40071.1 hypothetical protein FIU99_27145 [Vibrio sp. THAF64]QGM38016.1 hypothetical protein GGC04_27350 [Vibrio sp. THAF191d]QGN73524.1 hypothetical protein GGC03_27425 [Vibrio sp. THAF191c]